MAFAGEAFQRRIALLFVNVLQADQDRVEALSNTGSSVNLDGAHATVGTRTHGLPSVQTFHALYSKLQQIFHYYLGVAIGS